MSTSSAEPLLNSRDYRGVFVDTKSASKRKDVLRRGECREISEKRLVKSDDVFFGGVFGVAGAAGVVHGGLRQKV